MKNRALVFLLSMCMVSNAADAQEQGTDKKLFNHLDFGVTLGTSGVGFDFAMPVTDWVRLRTGFSYVPKVEVPMTFGIQVGDDAASSDEKFNRLSGYLTSMTGRQVKSEVEMLGKPNFWNWNFMVDVYPLKNHRVLRKWHVTAGFFLGPSKVAEAYNKTESMASLMAVSIYNNMYDRLHGLSRRELVKVKLIDIPGMDIGTDPEVLLALQEGLDHNGRMSVQLGKYSHDYVDAKGVEHKKGETYKMDPDENSMVKADMSVNAFKPYIGIGFDGKLLKNDKRLYVGFDAGVMFWGGTPHLTTHDGTDLIHDVEDIGGKVGDYVSVIEKFKAFPLLNLRISYKLF